MCRKCGLWSIFVAFRNKRYWLFGFRKIQGGLLSSWATSKCSRKGLLFVLRVDCLYEQHFLCWRWMGKGERMGGGSGRRYHLASVLIWELPPVRSEQVAYIDYSFGGRQFACGIVVKTDLKFCVLGFMVRCILVPFVSAAVIFGSRQRCAPFCNWGPPSHEWCDQVPQRAFHVLIPGVQLKSGPLTKPWIFRVRCYL